MEGEISKVWRKERAHVFKIDEWKKPSVQKASFPIMTFTGSRHVTFYFSWFTLSTWRFVVERPQLLFENDYCVDWSAIVFLLWIFGSVRRLLAQVWNFVQPFCTLQPPCHPLGRWTRKSKELHWGPTLHVISCSRCIKGDSRVRGWNYGRANSGGQCFWRGRNWR